MIENLLYLDRSDAGPQGGGQQHVVFLHTLAAQQGSENSHHPGGVIQVSLVHHLVQGEIGEELHKLRIRFPQRGRRAGKETGQIVFGRCGKRHTEKPPLRLRGAVF
ncbi:Uncharacterised protein [uncultured Blautia sp.]|nr:Uncharacterised protein [uncultured Blautia sp.]